MEDWKPQARLKLLPGPSAIRLAFVGMWSCLSILVLLAVLVVGMVVRGVGYANSTWLTVVLLLMLTNVASAITVAFWYLRKDKKETRAGYVTSMRSHIELDQVHPVTGWVIRGAGESFILRVEYLRRVRIIKNAGE